MSKKVRLILGNKVISQFVGFLLSLLALTAVAMAQNPVPLLYQPLVPDTITPGSAAFTLTVHGTGFARHSVVTWNGKSRLTTFVSSTTLLAKIHKCDLAAPTTASVAVINPNPGGGTSNIVFFPISLPAHLSLGKLVSPAGSGPKAVATGDFNGDGILDLVVPDTSTGDVSILLGNGDGTFQPPVSYAVGQGASPQFFQVAVADVNADGKLDFLVSDWGDNYVSVFLGNGDGTFQPGVTYSTGVNPSSVAVADLNRDGNLDIVVANQDCTLGGPPCGAGTVSILLGKGDGTFRALGDFASGAGPNGVTVGDFNRDGKLDLAVADGNAGGLSAVNILLGNGDGTFQTPVSYPLSTNGDSVATADFNHDDKLDLAVVDNIGLVSILLGNGDGTFQARADYPTGPFPFGSIGIGDFNEDGHLDLAIANTGTNTISILLGKNNGTFQTQVQPATGASPQGVAVGDFNGDGRLDIAIPNFNDNTVSVLFVF